MQVREHAGQTTEGVEMRKVLSPVAAWAFALGCTVGWGAFVMPTSIFLPAAGPLGTALAFVVGTVAMLLVAANYGYMACHCGADDGGVYAYARAVFGPNHAFVCSWCLVLAYCSSIVSNATALALVARSLIGSVLQVGFHYVIAGYDVYLGEVVSGVVVIAAVAQLLVRSTKASARIETVLSLGMMAGGVILAGLLLTSPQAHGSSIEPLFSPRHAPLAGTLIVLAEVPWAFIGFESVSQLAGECTFPRRRLARIMALAIVSSTFLYLVLNMAVVMTVPEGYASWVPYVDDAPLLAGMSMPTFLAGEALAGRAGILLFGVTAFCAVLSGVVGFSVVVTRLIYVMALDRALPRRFARLHRDYRTPVAAVLIIMAPTMVVPFLGRNVLSWIIDLMSLGALIAYIYTSLATFLTARSEGNGLMVAVGVGGLAFSCLCLLLLLVPVPGLGTSLSKESYVILLAWVALGVNFFTPTVMRDH